MDTVTVRPADMSDHAVVSALYDELFAVNAAMQPGQYQSGDASAYVAESIRREDRDILLAEAEGEVAGFAMAVEQETPVTNSSLVPHRYGVLVDIVVWPRARNLGVGAKLIDGVKDWAAERQLEYLELTVLAENEKAMRVYRREGFETVQHVMRCTLAPPMPTILN